MTPVVIPLTMGSIEMLPAECRRCVAWELDPDAAREALSAGDTEFEKEVWLSGIMLTWGSAGQVVTVDGEAVGFALYAPPTAVPGARAFPTSPVSPDAVLLTAARIRDDHTGQGLARFLMNGVVRELTRRGVRAIELFGREQPDPAAPGDENITTAPRVTVPGEEAVPQCLVPAGFARAVGFAVVAPHPRYPRLRYELERELGWKAEVEAALEKLFTTISVPGSPSPVRELAGAGVRVTDVSGPPRCGSFARGRAGRRS